MYFKVPSLTSWSTQRLPTCAWASSDRRKHTYRLSTSLVTAWRNQQTTHKFVLNLRNKTNYIIHHRNIMLYLEVELRLTNFHRIVLFNQTPWLENYINFNTRKRTAGKYNFGKDFFKLINNVVFDKSFLALGLYVLMYWFIHCFIHCS